jgi:LytR cell envelope-related transcriptional attenuator
MLPVEHVLQSPTSHPWRMIAVVAAAVATLELLGLVVTGTALLAKPVAKRARAAAEKRATVPPAVKPHALLPRGKVRVTVLNGNGIAGAAAATASQVRARGYRIGRVGNASGAYGLSVVMYRPGRQQEAARLAHDLGIRRVSPLDGMLPRQLHGAMLALIVGSG